MGAGIPGTARAAAMICSSTILTVHGIRERQRPRYDLPRVGRLPFRVRYAALVNRDITGHCESQSCKDVRTSGIDCTFVKFPRNIVYLGGIKEEAQQRGGRRWYQYQFSRKGLRGVSKVFKVSMKHSFSNRIARLLVTIL